MENTFIVNEQQRAIMETVARFVEEEVKPRAAKLDADPDPEKGFSWEIVEKAHESRDPHHDSRRKMGRPRHRFADHRPWSSRNWARAISAYP